MCGQKKIEEYDEDKKNTHKTEQEIRSKKNTNVHKLIQALKNKTNIVKNIAKSPDWKIKDKSISWHSNQHHQQQVGSLKHFIDQKSSCVFYQSCENHVHHSVPATVSPKEVVDAIDFESKSVKMVKELLNTKDDYSIPESKGGISSIHCKFDVNTTHHAGITPFNETKQKKKKNASSSKNTMQAYQDLNHDNMFDSKLQHSLYLDNLRILEDTHKINEENSCSRSWSCFSSPFDSMSNSSFSSPIDSIDNSDFSPSIDEVRSYNQWDTNQSFFSSPFDNINYSPFFITFI